MARTGNAYYRRQRAEVLKASDVCWLCGRVGADTVDHVIPYADGGTDDAKNLRPAHKSCNSARGRRDAASLKILRTSREW